MDNNIEDKKLKRQRTLFGSAMLGLFYLMVSAKYGTLNVFQWARLFKDGKHKDR